MDLSISVTFNFFMCYVRRTFRFEKNKFILIKGESGKGKSAIFDGIQWCLYGKYSSDKARSIKTDYDPTVINSIVSSRGNLEQITFVQIHYPVDEKTTFSIERKDRAPKGLVLTILSTESESTQLVRKYDEEAQKIINEYFGTYILWKSTSYISQTKLSAFLKADNNKKLAVLNEIAFSDSDPTKFISSIKEKIKALKKLIVQKDIELRTLIDSYNQNYLIVINGQPPEYITEIVSTPNMEEFLNQLKNNIQICISNIQHYEKEILANHKLSTQLNTLSNRRNMLVFELKNLGNGTNSEFDRSKKEERLKLEEEIQELSTNFFPKENQISLSLMERENSLSERFRAISNAPRQLTLLQTEKDHLEKSIQNQENELIALKEKISLLGSTEDISSVKIALSEKEKEWSQIIVEKTNAEQIPNETELNFLIREISSITTEIAEKDFLVKKISNNKIPKLKQALDYFKAFSVQNQSLFDLTKIILEKSNQIQTCKIFIDSCNLQCPHCFQHSSLSIEEAACRFERAAGSTRIEVAQRGTERAAGSTLIEEAACRFERAAGSTRIEVAQRGTERAAGSTVIEQTHYKLTKINSDDLAVKKEEFNRLSIDLANLKGEESSLRQSIHSLNGSGLGLSLSGKETLIEILSIIEKIISSSEEEISISLESQIDKKNHLQDLLEKQKHIQNKNEIMLQERKEKMANVEAKMASLRETINQLREKLRFANERETRFTLFSENLEILKRSILEKKKRLEDIKNQETLEKAIESVKEYDLIQKELNEIRIQKENVFRNKMELTEKLNLAHVKLKNLNLELEVFSRIETKREILKKEMQEITVQMNEINFKYKTEELQKELQTVQQNKLCLEYKIKLCEQFILLRNRQKIIYQEQLEREGFVIKLTGFEKLRKISTDTMYLMLDQTVEHINYEISEILPSIFSQDMSFSLCSKKPLKTASKATGEKYRYEVNIQLNYKGSTISGSRRLSPGEKQRISFALCLVLSRMTNTCPFFILDESFVYMDVNYRKICMDLLFHCSLKKTIFFIQHGVDESNFNGIVEL